LVVEQVEADNGPVIPEGSFVARLSGYVADGLRYWEPRRVMYNGVLAAVVLLQFALAWPAAQEKLSFDLVLGLFVLAVLANICYCAAYLADIFVQFSGLQAAWHRGRVLLLIVGTTFAAIIAHFMANGIFGGPATLAPSAILLIGF
jgi:hypothetical protein